MRLIIDGAAWNQGFWDGEAGRPLWWCPYPHSSTERLSWLSGYIEGDAARKGFKATPPCTPRPRADAVCAEPSAAPLRAAAPVSAQTADTSNPVTSSEQSSVENRPTEGVKIAQIGRAHV